MLKVEGIDPARIKCEEDAVNVRRIRLDDIIIARMGGSGASFYGEWTSCSPDFQRDVLAVMNACIDEWRASGGKRLWPEPPPEPVPCVCGAGARASKCAGRDIVTCRRPACVYSAESVAEWNAIQDTLKATKSSLPLHQRRPYDERP